MLATVLGFKLYAPLRHTRQLLAPQLLPPLHTAQQLNGRPPRTLDLQSVLHPSQALPPMGHPPCTSPAIPRHSPPCSNDQPPLGAQALALTTGANSRILG
jgi:hypothetical protein